MSSFKHIIFDLDHTLWDFDRNSRETLDVLFKEYSLKKALSTSFSDFLNEYYKVTNALWKQYDKKEISKAELRNLRLPLVFKAFNFINQELAKEIENKYLSICPHKPHLIDGAIEVLEYLKLQNTPLHLLTNGFKEIQFKKIRASKIEHYFKSITTSECSGFSKPDKRAYFFALDQLEVQPEECLMIGDNLVSDIQGSLAIGMKNIFFNPDRIAHNESPTFEISSLREIKGLI